MAKLKFDRLINLRLNDKETIVVPKNEYWKVQMQIGNYSFEVEGIQSNKKLDNYTVVEDMIIKNVAGYSNYPLSIRGIAFKQVQE